MPRSETWAFMVELLTAYSHTAQASDARLCHTVALTGTVAFVDGGSGELLPAACHVME